MTLRTRAAVDSSSSPLPLSTRETVVLLTLARAATSAMVMGTCPPTGVVNGHQRAPEPVSVPVPAVNSGEPGHVNEAMLYLDFETVTMGGRACYRFALIRLRRRLLPGGRPRAAPRPARRPRA